MVLTSSAHVERLCLPWMAATAVPKAPMAVTSSAHVTGSKRSQFLFTGWQMRGQLGKTFFTFHITS